MAKNEDGKWGSKMIKFSVQFWTNNLPKGTNNRTAWGSGAIHIIANKSRGLKHDNVFFNNLDEFMPKFQELIDMHEIKLITRPEKFLEVKLAK